MTLIEILERRLDGISARFLRSPRSPCGRDCPRNALHPLLGLALAGKQRIKKNIDNAADGGGGEEEYGNNLHSLLRLGLVGGLCRVECSSQILFFAIVASAIPRNADGRSRSIPLTRTQGADTALCTSFTNLQST